MKGEKRDKGRLWALVFGISIMGVLYGWFVYAGEIETEVSQLASSGSSSGPGGIPLPQSIDQKAINMMISVRNSVEGQQNSGIIDDMYSLNPMTPADLMITRHFSDYCVPGLEFGNCEADPLLVFGDVKVTSIMSGSSYTPARAKAAQDYMANLFRSPTAPAVPSFQTSIPMEAGKIMNNDTMKAEYIQALSDETVLSIARQPFAEMIAKRTVPEGEDAMSEMQMMESKAVSRLFSSQWEQSLNSLKPEEREQEQLKMQAYQIWLEYQRYRQTERVEALLGLIALQNFQSAKGTKAAIDQGNSAGSQGSGEVPEEYNNY